MHLLQHKYVQYFTTFTTQFKYYTMSQKRNRHYSQGSVATRLRCGGKYNNNFAANFLLSPAVKECFKSVNISKSYA